MMVGASPLRKEPIAKRANPVTKTILNPVLSPTLPKISRVLVITSRYTSVMRTASVGLESKSAAMVGRATLTIYVSSAAIKAANATLMTIQS